MTVGITPSRFLVALKATGILALKLDSILVVLKAIVNRNFNQTFGRTLVALKAAVYGDANFHS